MKDKPFFSIIIPAYNEEKYLPLLLQDIANQTSSDYEVIVVNGQSTDNTVKNIQKFKKILPSFKVFTSKVRNVSYQRNLGAFKATGEYLIFNDADNRLPKFFLNDLATEIKKSPVDLFTCWTKSFDPSPIHDFISLGINLQVHSSYLFKDPMAYGALIGCRRKIFKNIGGFDRNVGYGEDEVFIKTGYKKGYSFKVFKNPYFHFSLRRYDNKNAVQVLWEQAILKYKLITHKPVDQKKEYPMGGEIF